MAGLQYYDITIPANFQRSIGSEGTYFRYMKGSAGGADEGLLVKADTGALAAIIYPGQSIRLPETVREWRLENYKNAGTISGIVVIGDGEIQDSQVAGTVNVVDGGRARTLGGSAFVGTASSSAVAGQYPYVQLFNPVASGKNVIVEALICGVSVAGYSTFRPYTTALTLVGNASSKKIGGTASSAEMRILNSASVLGGPSLCSFSLPALSNYSFKFSEPIVLIPGQGLIAQGALAGDLTTSFEFFEEPN